MSQTSVLSKLVDCNDLDRSETLLRARLVEATGLLKLEVQTQIARVLGLRGQFEAASELLQSVGQELIERPSLAGARLYLEEGRLHLDQSRPDEAKRCFLLALNEAESIGSAYLACDAIHMLAISGGQANQIEWGERALQKIEQSEDPDAKGWLGAVVNNLGWSYFESGQLERALILFKESVEVRKSGPVKPYLIARYTVARTLRALGRYEGALEEARALKCAHLEISSSAPFVEEELAENLLALDYLDESRIHFANAYEALSKIESIVAQEPERLERLKWLAGSQSLD